MTLKQDSEQTREEAAEIVSGGGVIAFRTDTFYGLGADPFNAYAVRKIRKLKGREEGKPILILISDLKQLDRFVAYSKFFRTIADEHWPAPLTLVGVARPELPDELTAGTNTIGLRLPDDADVRALVRVCGGALTATSANVSGDEPASTAAEVANYFPTGIDLIIDGGDAAATHASTVVDLNWT